MAEDATGLFVFEGDEATVFWSLDEAARWLDAAEVGAGAHEIFSIDGREVVATRAGGRIELTAGGHAEHALAERLARTCRALGLESAPDDVAGVARELYRRDF
jgi:hypothetical protein